MTTIPTKHLAVGLTSADSGVVAFEVPTLEPADDQVLIRVDWASVSFLEFWQAEFKLLVQYPQILGIAKVGEVAKAGKDAGVQVGDTVLSFGMFTNEERAFQEYVLTSKYMVGKVPANISPREAVTVPDNLTTVYYSLFGKLSLPPPTELPAKSAPPEANTPILVWGAGGSAGQYALQLLHLAGYTNVIGIASAHHHDYLRSLGAAVTIDYRAKDIVQQISKAAGGPIKYVFDTVSNERDSLGNIAKLVGSDSQVAHLLPVRDGGMGEVQGVKLQTDTVFPSGVQIFGIKVVLYHLENEKLKEELQPKIIPKLLAEGLIKPNRVREMVGESLVDRVNAALELFKKGEVSGERLVVKVSQ